MIERVQRRQNLHAGTEERVVPDMYVAYIEHDAIEVEEYARTEMDVGAVVTVERRLHPYAVAASAKKIPENPSSIFSL